MVLNMPSKAVKVRPIANMDFIFTMFRSRLFDFNCSSCFSSFFLAGFNFVSPSCSFFLSTAVRHTHTHALSTTARVLYSGYTIIMVTNYAKDFKTLVHSNVPFVLTLLALFLHDGLKSFIVVSSVNQDIENACKYSDVCTY